MPTSTSLRIACTPPGFTSATRKTLSVTNVKRTRLTTLSPRFSVGRGYAIVEMRNRFKIGDELEVLSPAAYHNAIIKVEKMEDEEGNAVADALLVKQKLKLYTSVPLAAGDMLRRR
ncbi:MAG: U32 family peptidase C-terminal domain-containing protein [Christensenellales bacterium]